MLLHLLTQKAIRIFTVMSFLFVCTFGGSVSLIKLAVQLQQGSNTFPLIFPHSTLPSSIIRHYCFHSLIFINLPFQSWLKCISSTIFSYFWLLCPIWNFFFTLFHLFFFAILVNSECEPKKIEFFFAFAVSMERWCRLRGNLLFYFKNSDQFSEPQGVIVLEKCDPVVRSKNREHDGFVFFLGMCVYLLYLT